MDYTIRVLCKCRDYGFRVYMDPHQDTVSFTLCSLSLEFRVGACTKKKKISVLSPCVHTHSTCLVS